ncbi:unnamed protein product [Laminaria digitata]
MSTHSCRGLSPRKGLYQPDIQKCVRLKSLKLRTHATSPQIIPDELRSYRDERLQPTHTQQAVRSVFGLIGRPVRVYMGRCMCWATAKQTESAEGRYPNTFEALCLSNIMTTQP